MAKTLEDLREHLFATLESLRDKEKPMEIERAKAISDIAQTVINSAKAEVNYVRAVGRQDLALPVFTTEQVMKEAEPAMPRVVTHRIKG